MMVFIEYDNMYFYQIEIDLILSDHATDKGL